MRVGHHIEMVVKLVVNHLTQNRLYPVLDPGRPGEFNCPHTIVIDVDGIIFVVVALHQFMVKPRKALLVCSIVLSSHVVR